jgi:glutamate synthase (NADPH/NADH) large chain
VATQDPELRRRFTGQPEYLVNYFFFVAEELRELMAQIGIRKFDDLIGRSDLLDMKKGIEHWKARGLDYSLIFQRPAAAGEPISHREKQDHGLSKTLDKQLIELAKPALEKGKTVRIELPIRNADRTVGTMLSGRVVEKYGHAGLPDNTIHIVFQGAAGQSFGAFLAHGVTLDLVGDGNDYVGKGLSGGRIIVRPNPAFPGESSKNIIVGNTVLYGAIEGEAFFSGVAGERFAVRNSGATIVVEGVGDHGCEYMTGGTVVVLGMTGRNFAAGMSGGVAFVLDEEETFKSRCNQAQVALEAVESVEEEIAGHQGSKGGKDSAAGDTPEGVRHLGMTDEALLKSLVVNHARHTGSAVARRILDDWAAYRARFVKVMPHEYRRALTEMAAAAAQKQSEVV